jgi:hypothetical protein
MDVSGSGVDRRRGRMNVGLQEGSTKKRWGDNRKRPLNSKRSSPISSGSTRRSSWSKGIDDKGGFRAIVTGHHDLAQLEVDKACAELKSTYLLRH